MNEMTQEEWLFCSEIAERMKHSYSKIWKVKE